MKFLTTFVLLSTFVNVYGQVDTTKIYKIKPLKRGVYKSYKEYLNNAPSYDKDFIISEMPIKQSDSTLVFKPYKINGSVTNDSYIWGICDGETIYINYKHSMFRNRCFKIDYLKPFPSFVFEKNPHPSGKPNIIIFRNPALLALEAIAVIYTLSSPTYFELIVVTDKGETKTVSENIMRTLLSKYPDLLHAFEGDINKLPKNLSSEGYMEVDESTEIKRTEIFKLYLEKLNAQVGSRISTLQ